MLTFLETMCKYVAILVYQGLIEDVNVFDEKEGATRWLSERAGESGIDCCGDSMIWDTTRGEGHLLSFAISRS